MPNRQEVLDALRILSEDFLESLRILFHLFYMLVTMTRAVQPEEGVTEADMTPINHLVAEVRSQKAKITELGEIIQKRFLQSQSNPSGPRSSSPVNSATVGLESWEIAELEAAEMEVPVHAVSQHLSQGPKTFRLPPKQQLRATPGLLAFHSVDLGQLEVQR